QAKDSPAPADRVEHAPTRLVTESRLPGRTEAAPKQEQDNSDLSGQQGREHTPRAEPPDQEQVQPTREPVDVEVTQAQPSQVEGSDSSGSDHAGSSGGNSQPDGSTD